MTCDCKKRTRGRWSNGTQVMLWGVNSKCESGKLDFPDNFIAEASAPDSQQVAQAPVKVGQVALCCVTYKIAWQVTGLANGEIFTMRSFSVGDDSWGPFASQPAANGTIQDNREVSVCKEDADCTQQPIAKFVFDKQAGGAGQPVALGSVGDIKVCKLR